MKAQRDSTRESKAPAPGGVETRGHWSHGLLMAAVVVYGAGAVLVMAAPIPATVGGWLAGAVAVLVAVGLLASAVRLPELVLTPLWRRDRASDPWAELWEELMQRPVR